jgi:hypothetical protein
MSDTRPTGSQVIGEPAKIGSAETDGNCARLVLEAYIAAMTGSRDERRAFAAAVRVYRDHNFGLPEPIARHAVANILCGKE